MEKIKLIVPDGQLVAEFEIPLFTPAYEVLIWGIRTFVKHPSLPGHYVESPAYAIVTEPIK